MARELFPANLVVTPDGNPAPAQPVTVYTDDASGTDVSADLMTRDGSGSFTPVTTVEGLLNALRAPDGYKYALFVDTGLGGPRQMLLSPTVWRWLVDSVTNLLAGGGGGGGGGGGNTYTITDPTAQRLNPVTGDPIPVGAKVWWFTATEPPNMATDDIWQQTN